MRKCADSAIELAGLQTNLTTVHIAALNIDAVQMGIVATMEHSLLVLGSHGIHSEAQVHYAGDGLATHAWTMPKPVMILKHKNASQLTLLLGAAGAAHPTLPSFHPRSHCNAVPAHDLDAESENLCAGRQQTHQAHAVWPDMSHSRNDMGTGCTSKEGSKGLALLQSSCHDQYPDTCIHH